MINSALFFTDTKNRGRGVFTNSGFDPDTIIEISPVIVLNEIERELLDQTLLHDYIFEWQPNGENLCCMALGLVSIYNHTKNSNCEYFMNYDDKTIYIKTVRKIVAGEELTINYNGDWDNEEEVWFKTDE